MSSEGTTRRQFLLNLGALVVGTAVPARVVHGRLAPSIQGPLHPGTASPQAWRSARQPGFLFGNIGRSVEAYGIRQDMMGHYVNRATWDDVRNVNYMHSPKSGIAEWIEEYDGKRPLDEAITMVPAWPGNSSRFHELFREGASGRRDDAYVNAGRQLARHGPDVVHVRMQWEFNMHPASQDSETWKACWRRAYPRIHQGFAEEKRPDQELSIGWCTNAGPPSPEPFYPGDEYVDAIGMDRYLMKWGEVDPSFETVRDNILQEVWSLDWLREFALRHGKPVFIGETAHVARKGRTETGEMHGCGDEPRLIDTLFDWGESCLPSQGGPGILYMMWFNRSSGGVGTTLDEQPKSRERLQERVSALRTRSTTGAGSTR